MSHRITDRFESYTQLQEGHSDRHGDLLQLLHSIGISGTLFHVLKDIPDQRADLLSVLVDDLVVISFEVLRDEAPLVAQQISIVPVVQYRNALGQGKPRIRLDETLNRVRAALGSQCR